MIDEDYLTEIFGPDDAPGFERLLEIGYAALEDDIDKFFAATDVSTKISIAHRLKGASANMGASKLSELFLTLELNPETDIKREEVDQQFLKTQKALNEILKKWQTLSSQNQAG